MALDVPVAEQHVEDAVVPPHRVVGRVRVEDVPAAGLLPRARAGRRSVEFAQPGVRPWSQTMTTFDVPFPLVRSVSRFPFGPPVT